MENLPFAVNSIACKIFKHFIKVSNHYSVSSRGQKLVTCNFFQAEEEERQLEEQLQRQEAKSKKKGDARKPEAADSALPTEPLSKKAEKKLEQAKVQFVYTSHKTI